MPDIDRNILIFFSTGLIFLVVGCGVSTEDIDATVESRLEKQLAEIVNTATPVPPTTTPTPVPPTFSSVPTAIPGVEAMIDEEAEALEPTGTPVPTIAPKKTATYTPTPIPTATYTPTPIPTAVSTTVQDTATGPVPETCSTSPPVSGGSSTQDAIVTDLVARIAEKADPLIIIEHRERAQVIAQRARNAVVRIQEGTGSLISADGYIITNAHVVAESASVTVVTFDGRKYQGNVVATIASLDPDLALVKIDVDNFPFLPLAQKLTVGAIVVYVGHPQMIYWTSSGGKIIGTAGMIVPEEDGFPGLKEVTIDQGPVGKTWYQWTEVYYTNPTIGGSSGSSLLNCDGEIVGIVYAGGIEAPEPERTSAIYQNDVIWDLSNYLPLLIEENRAVGIDTLLAFLSEYAEGLVESNNASRESAVTRLADFVEPSFPDDLCRVCVIEDMPYFAEFIRGNSLEKQIDFLQELLTPEKSRTISAQDRAKVLAVGKLIQPAVIKLKRNGLHTGTGSFITPRGYIITNAHVVEDATELNVELFDGREYVAEVIGTTFPENQPDLALLKIKAENLPWIELASEVNIGDTIVGVGHPHNLEWVIWGGQVTYMDPVTAAEIQASILPFDKVIQDNSVNVGSGSSGSPIVNLDGKIVGIKNSSATDFTIPSEKLKLRSEWLQPAVIWDQLTWKSMFYNTPHGIHVDAVRKFINEQVPGLVD